ncbi:hypothetical protein DPV73_17395 [Leptospira mayottensis]|nr:hypothetical protein DPV73_17395 [Leptospira mayottensis]
MRKFESRILSVNLSDSSVFLGVVLEKITTTTQAKIYWNSNLSSKGNPTYLVRSHASQAAGKRRVWDRSIFFSVQIHWSLRKMYIQSRHLPARAIK